MVRAGEVDADAELQRDLRVGGFASCQQLGGFEGYEQFARDLDCLGLLDLIGESAAMFVDEAGSELTQRFRELLTFSVV